MILNFEQDGSGEVKIFLDDEGINVLASYLEKLSKNRDTHYHLMTESWGGYELTEENFDKNCTLVNQVLLQKIK